MTTSEVGRTRFDVPEGDQPEEAEYYDVSACPGTIMAPAPAATNTNAVAKSRLGQIDTAPSRRSPEAKTTRRISRVGAGGRGT